MGRPRADAAEFTDLATTLEMLRWQMLALSDGLHPGRAATVPLASHVRADGYAFAEMAAAIAKVAEACAKLARR